MAPLVRDWSFGPRGNLCFCSECCVHLIMFDRIYFSSNSGCEPSSSHGCFRFYSHSVQVICPTYTSKCRFPPLPPLPPTPGVCGSGSSGAPCELRLQGWPCVCKLCVTQLPRVADGDTEPQGGAAANVGLLGEVIRPAPSLDRPASASSGHTCPYIPSRSGAALAGCWPSTGPSFSSAKSTSRSL